MAKRKAESLGRVTAEQNAASSNITARPAAAKKRKTAAEVLATGSDQAHHSDSSVSDADNDSSESSDDADGHDDDESDGDDDDGVDAVEVAGTEQRNSNRKPDEIKIRGKLHHHVKTVRSAAKKSRAFERQRVVKKLKAARSGKNVGGADEATLAAELEVFKSIPTAPIAAAALLSKMAKSKLIPRGEAAVPLTQREMNDSERAQYPLWEASLAHKDLGPLLRDRSTQDATSAAVPEAKAKARLASSKVLADAVVAAVADLLALLNGTPTIKATAGGKSNAGVAPSAVEKSKPSSSSPGAGNIGTTKGKKWLESRDWSGEESEGDEEVDDDHSDRQSAGSEDENEGSNSEGGGSDSEVGDDSEQDMGVFGEEWDAFVASASSQGSESDTEAAKKKGIAQETTSRPKKRRRAASSASSSASSVSDANLPALATGFITSSLRLRNGDDGRGTDDSFSEEEGGEGEIESDAEEGGKAKGTQKAGETRKNRRGQRARKAIWEKKYGRNANHVKLQLKEQRRAAASERRNGVAPSSDSARPRRGAPLPGTPWDKPAAGQGWSGRTPGQSIDAKAPPTKVVPPTTRSEDPALAPPKRQQRSLAAASKTQEMHPSWIAKQRQKDIAASAARGGTGTKVTFGEHGAQSQVQRPTPTTHVGGPRPNSAAATSKQAEELHPSWVAKQRQKELLAKAATGGAGKKITFD